MMQMLAAGGVDLITDNTRQADADNPKGYFEYEKVKRLHEDASWLASARGKAVKVIAALLQYLPPNEQYKILFMQRPLEEVLASQKTMLEHRQATSSGPDDTHLAAVFATHLHTTQAWLQAQPHMEVLYVQYHAVLDQPRDQAQRIQDFLERRLDIGKMVHVIDPTLYRNRV